MSAKISIESVMISDHDFNKDLFDEIKDIKVVNDLWPLVYIISNENIKEAYVGESASAIHRMETHLRNDDKAKLNKIHLITSEKFNKSVTLELESKLIKYIAGDGKFRLQNGNVGLARHTYYQKDDYQELFIQLWQELINEQLADNSLKAIDASNLFVYSPYKSLNDDQYASVKEIISILTQGISNSIFIEGSAGTGKTVLAMFMIKLLVTDEKTLFETGDLEIEEMDFIRSLKAKFPNPKVALVVPMAPLRETLKKVFKNISGLDESMVIAPYEVTKAHYNILLVDEAHRLKQRVNLTNYKSFDDTNAFLELDNGTELDWIKKRSDHRILFYDPAQSIKPSDIKKERFDDEISLSKKVLLQSQLRVKGGKDYIDYIDKLMHVSLGTIPPFESKDYELFLFDSVEELIKQVKKKNTEIGLSRVVAGFSWPWSRNDKKAHDIELNGKKYQWNTTDKDWINSTNSINEIGCIHTTQGYDLNYTGLIFGKEISYNTITKKIFIIPQNYHDSKGKNGLANNEEALQAFIINIYKTLMYRGIRGTYVYACDKNLQAYLREHIQTIKRKVPTKTISLNQNIQPKDKKESNKDVPFYDISVAAGGFSEAQEEPARQWIELPNREAIKEGTFVCRVVGESMNEKIPNGSLCLFEQDSGGSRNGKIVLVEHRRIQDPDFGAGFTVKEYHSEKIINQEGWQHTRITLKPKSKNPGYEDIVLQPDESGELKVLGVFVAVLS